MKELSFFDERLIKKYFTDKQNLRIDIKNVNFSLLYSHYPRFDKKEQKFIFYTSKDSDNKATDRSKTDDKWLLGNKPIRKDEYEFFNTQDITKTQTNHYQAIQDLGLKTNEIELSPEWRMNIGLGGESAYETAITLHHIYGFPYIPATAIKGIAHHYAAENKFQNIDAIFGVDSDTSPQKGKIIFFDAFPITSPILSPDIMNNHYPDYYEGGKKPPADWQSPRPILFLTVKETKFKFVLGIKPKDEKDNPKLLQKAIDLLNSALKEKGIGAKTAVGYGYMQ